MKLYIPDIGDLMRLTSDWNFYLMKEHRNHLDLDQFGTGNKIQKDSIAYYKNYEHFYEAIIPKGSLLKVDRVYIRKGAFGFSSITFNLIEVDGKKIKAQRFWAHLRDCNKIEFDLDETNKNVKIQWPYSSIFRGKEDLPRVKYGVEGVYNMDHFRMPRNFHVDNIQDRYSESIEMVGMINGENIPFIIRDKVETSFLTDEEKEIIKNNEYFRNQFKLEIIGKSKKIKKTLDDAKKIIDWNLEIVNEQGEVVKTYKSLSSAKTWIKKELSK